jgi:tetratricopeptide (TPR) repeat protein
MRLAPLALLSAAILAAPAQAEWREATSDHFIIYSEQSEKSLREFAERLERFDAAMRSLRNLPKVPVAHANKLTVYAVSDIGDVRKLYGKGASNGNFGIAGFYQPRASGSLAFVARSTGDSDTSFDGERVLRHEYAHHFMMHNFPVAYPVWFIEGFAEFNSTARFEKNGTVGIGTPASHRARGLMMGPKLSVESLVSNPTGSRRGDEREAMYGRGWLLTHFLYAEPSRAGQLSAYLKQVNSGTNSLDAAREAFGDLQVLDKELESYLRRPKLAYWPIPAERLPIGKITIRTLSPAEDAMMEVKMRSKRGVNRQQALELLPLVRKAAAPFPNDPAVQATLAEAEYDAGNYAEAEAAADRAIASNPRHVDALIYKGRAKMALASASKSADAAAWKEVRKWLVAANRADPEDPEPLILFYSSFRAQGIKPTANAAIGLEEALRLAPQDQPLRMMAAFQYLADNKPAEARAALAPVAFAPHGGGMAKVASAVIAKIDSGAGKAALDALRNPEQGAEEEPSGS